MGKNDTSFKPGHNRPGPGRRKITEVERVVRESLRHNLAESAYLLEMTREEADALIKKNKKEGCLTLLQEHLLRGVAKNNDNIIQGFIKRLLGEAKQTIEQTGNVGPQVFVTLPSNGREVDKPKVKRKATPKKAKAKPRKTTTVKNGKPTNSN